MGLENPFEDASASPDAAQPAAEDLAAARSAADSALAVMTNVILPVHGRFLTLQQTGEELVVYLHDVDDSRDAPDHEIGSKTPVLKIVPFNPPEVALLEPGDRGRQGMTRLWVGVPGPGFETRLWEHLEPRLDTNEVRAWQACKSQQIPAGGWQPGNL